MTPVAARGTELAPERKVAAVLATVLAVVVTPREAFWAFGVLAALVALAVAVAGVPPRWLARRCAIELPFVVFALLLPIVGTGPRTAVGPITVSIAGSWAAWTILAKATLGTAIAALLAATTAPADILVGLERLRVPRALTAIAGFMVRYLDLVADELRRLQVARVSRGDDPRWLWQGRAVATTAGSMFVRTFERGERVQQAMLARGFTGHLPDLAGPRPARGRSDLVVVAWPIAAWVVALAAVVGS